jgi:hypothetical protein
VLQEQVAGDPRGAQSELEVGQSVRAIRTTAVSTAKKIAT